MAISRSVSRGLFVFGLTSIGTTSAKRGVLTSGFGCFGFGLRTGFGAGLGFRFGFRTGFGFGLRTGFGSGLRAGFGLRATGLGFGLRTALTTLRRFQPFFAAALRLLNSKRLRRVSHPFLAASDRFFLLVAIGHFTQLQYSGFWFGQFDQCLSQKTHRLADRNWITNPNIGNGKIYNRCFERSQKNPIQKSNQAKIGRIVIAPGS